MPQESPAESSATKRGSVAQRSAIEDQAAIMALASKMHFEKKRRRHPLRRLGLALCAAGQHLLEGSHGLWERFCISPASDDGTNRFIFDQQSRFISWWDSFLVLGGIYSTAFTPLIVVFRQARWTNHEVADAILDVLFTFDVVVRFRTSFRDHGYDVTYPPTIARHYIKGWFTLDILSSLPFDKILAAWPAVGTIAVLGQPSSRAGFNPDVEPITLVDIVSLLRIMRIGRLMRKLSALTGANFLRIMYLMYLFLLAGHWLGLVWYAIAIRPIEASEAYDAAAPWLWTLDKDAPLYFVALRYTCALYWALSVMTNLKGPPAHETRQCLIHEPEVSFITNPLGERVYTIVVFIVGCVLFSCIYGNINQFIQNLYASGMRYRKRMEEIHEFAKFHRLSPVLRSKIRNYVDFQWSVTKGINVDTIAAGLPAHLQVEMRLQLNKRLVEQVSIFAGCPREFFEALVSKLQPCICVAGDFVFYESEIGSRMYFIKRGVAQVGKGDTVFATFKEGDYFGEVALLTDQPRTASVIAVTDLMLLSLSCADLESVLAVFPTARTRIEAAAQERLKALARTDSSACAAPKAYLRTMRRDSLEGNRRGSWNAIQGAVGSLLRPRESMSRSNSFLRTSNSMGRSSENSHSDRRNSTGGNRVRRISHRLLTIPSSATGKIAPDPDDSDDRSSGAHDAASPTHRLTHRRPSVPDRRPSIADRRPSLPRRPSLDSRPNPSLGLGLARADEVRAMPIEYSHNPSKQSPGSRRGTDEEKAKPKRSQKSTGGLLGFMSRSQPKQAEEPQQANTARRPSVIGATRRPSVTGSSEPSSDDKSIVAGRRGSIGGSNNRSRRISTNAAADRSRRRSVDAGLDLVVQQPVPLSAAVVVPGVPRPVPAQWCSLRSSGTPSLGSRKSGGASALRLSLDGGFDSPDDQKRRSEIRRRQSNEVSPNVLNGAAAAADRLSAISKGAQPGCDWQAGYSGPSSRSNGSPPWSRPSESTPSHTQPASDEGEEANEDGPDTFEDADGALFEEYDTKAPPVPMRDSLSVRAHDHLADAHDHLADEAAEKRSSTVAPLANVLSSPHHVERRASISVPTTGGGEPKKPNANVARKASMTPQSVVKLFSFARRESVRGLRRGSQPAMIGAGAGRSLVAAAAARRASHTPAREVQPVLRPEPIVTGLTEEVLQARLQEALRPLIAEITRMSNLQAESISALRIMCDETSEINKRLYQLPDGKWM